MSNRIAMLAAAALALAACASNPAGTGGDIPTTPGGSGDLTPGAGTPAATAVVQNLAGTTKWVAEEKLMPEDPVLALVGASASNTNNPMGVLIRCNAANGAITVRLGKQPTNRIGQSATYRLRTGPGSRDLAGRFEAGRGGEAEFVFPMASGDLLALGQLDLVSFLSDQGEVQWALVKDAGATVQAKYVASLSGFAQASRDFVAFCNPK